jgi:hypothetical protein
VGADEGKGGQPVKTVRSGGVWRCRGFGRLRKPGFVSATPLCRTDIETLI